MTQAEAILEHLKKYGSITSMTAFINYGETRLSARIYDLRKQGFDIKTEKRRGKTRYGTATEYAVYKMEADKRAYQNL